MSTQKLQFKALACDDGKRLDVVISEKAPNLSRAQVQRAIQEKRVLVNNSTRKSSHRVNSGDVFEIEIPEPVALRSEPEDIPIEIMYEDSWIAVVNKPAGMVVHPACGNYTGTLVNALLYHCTSLAGIGGVIRPGIVHRLDKGTTGVLVIAKNDTAHRGLSRQFKEHSVIRKYRAVVFGSMDESEGVIRTLIGRHPKERKKMSARPQRGRNAVTHWNVKEAFDSVTLVEASLETGRTHQVRVHLASIGHPVVGDRVYGASKRLRSVTSKAVQDAFKGISRPLLHAGYLEFVHPGKNVPLAFEAPLPADFVHVLTVLRGKQC